VSRARRGGVQLDAKLLKGRLLAPRVRAERSHAVWDCEGYGVSVLPRNGIDAVERVWLSLLRERHPTFTWGYDNVVADKLNPSHSVAIPLAHSDPVDQRGDEAALLDNGKVGPSGD
jgi:hypothetical protein